MRVLRVLLTSVFVFLFVFLVSSAARWFDFFPMRTALSLRRSVNARTAMVSSFVDLAARVDGMETSLKTRLAELMEKLESMAKSSSSDDQ